MALKSYSTKTIKDTTILGLTHLGKNNKKL